MPFRGRMANGVVVLEGETDLKEGTLVTVEPFEPPPPDPLLSLTGLAAPSGIPDLAKRLDHYLYGHPKAAAG